MVPGKKKQEQELLYNHTLSFKKTKKDNLLQKILEKFKKDFLIEVPFYCDDDEQISIEKRFYENDRLIILDAKVLFEKDTFVGSDCSLSKVGHPLDYKTRNPVKIMKQLDHNNVNKEVII